MSVRRFADILIETDPVPWHQSLLAALCEATLRSASSLPNRLTHQQASVVLLKEPAGSLPVANVTQGWSIPSGSKLSPVKCAVNPQLSV